MKGLGRLLWLLIGLVFRLILLLAFGKWIPFEKKAEPQSVPGGSSRSATPPSSSGALPSKPAASAAVASGATFANKIRALRARRGHDAVTAATLADMEALAEDLLEPLYAHAAAQELPLARREVVALDGVDPALSEQVARATPLFVLAVPEVPPRGSTYRSAVEQTAARVVGDLSGLVSEVRQEHGLPVRLALAEPWVGYPPGFARAALGVWLPELLTDVIAVHLLGVAYVHSVLPSLASEEAPMAVCVARVGPQGIAPAPPALIRVYTLCRTLEFLGFIRESQQLLSGYLAAHGSPEALFYPMLDASLFPVPWEGLRAQWEEVLVHLLDEPHGALGDERFLDVPGFAYLHAEQAATRRIASLFVRGQPSFGAPRVLTSAALSALEADPARAQMVLLALARSIRGASTLETVPDAYSDPALLTGGKSSHGPASLASMIRNPRSIRRALVWGAALSDAPSARRREGSR